MDFDSRMLVLPHSFRVFFFAFVFATSILVGFKPSLLLLGSQIHCQLGTTAWLESKKMVKGGGVGLSSVIVTIIWPAMFLFFLLSE